MNGRGPRSNASASQMQAAFLSLFDYANLDSSLKAGPNVPERVSSSRANSIRNTYCLSSAKICHLKLRPLMRKIRMGWILI